MLVKQQLLALCHSFIDERIANCRQAIDTANASITEETKSSAGDKYETSREMMTQEIKNVSAQLAEAVKQKQMLSQILIQQAHNTVQPGSLVITNHEIFFVAISAGVLQLNNKTYMVVSALSPIGKTMLAKKAGDSFSFNNKEYLITAIS